MALFSQMRKLLGLALAIVIVATSIQPVQAHLRSGEEPGSWFSNAPWSANSLGALDAALYISEETESQTGRKGPSSQRLGTGDPFVVVAETPAAVLIPVPRYVLPRRAPPNDGGIFLSPLKTGPPSF
jgi:hypothetical protein